MARNIEIKARVADMHALAARAASASISATRALISMLRAMRRAPWDSGSAMLPESHSSLPRISRNTCAPMKAPTMGATQNSHSCSSAGAPA